MSYTILRPVAFMENFTPDFMGKAFGATLAVGLPADKPLQYVSTSDIGHFAAQAFINPEKNKNRAIALAGDDLTFAQVDQVFKDKTGSGVPQTFGFIGSAVLWGVKEMGSMFEFFRGTGYGVQIPELKKEHPGLMTLGDWIEKKSAWAKK